MTRRTPSQDVTGVVLAAGASSRPGFPKALATLGGSPFVARVARALRCGGCREVIVVVGSPHAQAVARALGDVALVTNPDPARGMLSSLQAALATALDHEPGAVLVALVDQPRLCSTTVSALIEAWRISGAELVRPRYGGRRGHPYLANRLLAERLVRAPLTANASARPVLASAGSVFEVDVDDPAVIEDLDTAEEIARAGAERP